MPSHSQQSEQLDQAIAKFMASEDAGERPDPEMFVRENPDVAEQLRRFFVQNGRLTELASPAGEVSARFGSSLGRYKLLSELGRGGLGIVYEAIDSDNDERVAVKVLSLPASLDGRHMVRFRNEAQSLRSLDHEHIVKVLDVCELDGQPFYSMQIVDGGSLSEWIERQRTTGDKVDPKLIARIALQVADALDHAHQLGVLHRDIKPSNILLDSELRPYLADFGLARLPGMATLTLTGDIIGTLRYASPEQVSGQRTAIDERSDVYSLGATFWEMLTLQPLFPQEDRRQIIHAVMSADPSTMRNSTSRIPRDLETIVLKCLSNEPAGRYQKAKDLADDLHRYKSGVPIVAKRPTLTEKTGRWMRRNHLIATTFVLALCLLTCVSLISTIAVRKSQRETADALEVSQQNERRALESERRAMQLRYASDMRAASEAFRNRDLNSLQRYVRKAEAYDPDRKLRHIEWDYLRSKCDSQSELFYQGPKWIYEIAFTPNGKHLMSGGQDGIVRCHDLDTGRVIREFQSGQIEINDITFSPDGKCFTTAGDDRTVKMWDSETYKLLRTFTHETADTMWFAKFSADGKRLLTTANKGFMAFDVESGKHLGTYELDPIQRDCRMIVPLANGQLLVPTEFSFDLYSPTDDGYERLTSTSLATGTTHTCGIAVDPKRDRLIHASQHNSLVLRRLSDLGERVRMPLNESINELAYFPKSELLFGATKYGVKAFRIQEYRSSLRVNELTSWIEPNIENSAMFNVAASPDENTLYLTAGNQIRRCSVESLGQAQAAVMDGLVCSSQTSGDFALLRENGVSIGHDQERLLFEGEVFDAELSTAGDKLAVVTLDHRLKILDASTAEILHDVVLPRSRPQFVSWSQDDGYVILRYCVFTNDVNRTGLDALTTFRLSDGRFINAGDANTVTGAVIDRHGHLVYGNGTLPVTLVARDADSNEVIWTQQPDSTGVSDVALHPSEDVAAVCRVTGKAVELVRTDTGEVMHRLTFGNDAAEAAWSPDGKRLAIALRVVMEVVLIDYETLDEVLRIPNPNTVVGITFIDDGRTLAFPVDFYHSPFDYPLKTPVIRIPKR